MTERLNWRWGTKTDYGKRTFAHVDYVAVFVSWVDLADYTGIDYQHTEHDPAERDTMVMNALVEADAPEWVLDCDGCEDEYGLTFFSRELPVEDEVERR